MDFFEAGPALDVVIYVESEGISHVDVKPSKKEGFSVKIVSKGAVDKKKIESIQKWMQNYAQKRPSSTPLLPLKNAAFPSWTSKVLLALQKIPFGHTMSYQELAVACGNPKGSRAAGNACGRNPWPLLVPCHRILQKNGCLGGFSAGLEVKKRLLIFEDILPF